MLKLDLGGAGRVASSALLGTDTIQTFSSVMCCEYLGSDGSGIDKRIPEL